MRKLSLVVLLILSSAASASAVCIGNPAGRCAGDNNGTGTVTIDELVQGVTAALEGCETAPCQTDFFPIEVECGNGEIEIGEACDFGNLGGQTCVSQGFAGGRLECAPGCTFDTRACTPIRFIDNGDGTVTDQTTELMWTQHTVDCAETPTALCERLLVDRGYRWSSEGGSAAGDANGSAFTELLSAVNRCASDDGNAMSGGLGGHCDWRLPTVRELQTILLEPHPCSVFPCIDPIFGFINSGRYWSATTATDPGQAWAVDFSSGALAPIDKVADLRVRAVRSVTACGNGRVDLGEQCDGTAFGGATCDSVGFSSGTLACAPGCNLDTSGCVGCVADCQGDGEVDAGDLARAGAIFRGEQSIDACPSADSSGSGGVAVSDLLRALQAAIHGCAVAERLPEPDPAAVSLDVEGAVGPPGSTVQVTLRLRANGATVGAAQAMLALDPARAYRFVSCTPGADIFAVGSTGALQPDGCAAGGRCTKAVLVGLSLEEPIADGTAVYSCAVAIDQGAPTGSYPVTILSPLASDPNGDLLASTGSAGRVDVVPPTPLPGSAAADGSTPTPTPL